MKTAFIYTDAYLDYDYGPTHPLRIARLQASYELIRAYGLVDLPSAQFMPTRKGDEESLALFHSKDYLDVLKEANEGHFRGNASRYGLGPGDNPIFPGLYDWSLWITGATLQAVEFVANGEGEIAFNIAGGLHHAMRSKASGFCYINDPVIGILRLLDRGMRVVYIDIDAHHGDGVQTAFYETDQVLTISLHETGCTLFPGSGFEYEIGEGKGKGFSVNVPLPPYTDDELYLWAFEEIVPPLVRAFQPNVVVTQLGVDTFFNDPLTNLHLTILGYEKVIRRMKSLVQRWVALGGGGYDISNVARAWTLTWAVMNGIELKEELPDAYLEKASKWGTLERKLRELSGWTGYRDRSEIRKETDRVVKCIKETVFPIVGASSQ
jgi:acetoin utilization protein AcuC